VWLHFSVGDHRTLETKVDCQFESKFSQIVVRHLL